MEKPDFLDKKYSDLAGSKPVERAVVKAKKDPERKFVPHTREERIQAYIDRLDSVVKDERGWELLKHKLNKEFVIDVDDEDTLLKIARGLYESEKRIAIEQGRGNDIEQLAEGEVIEKYKESVKEKRDIQKRTLKSWLDYLHGNDAEYPTWFRYFVVRNLQKMGTLDKVRGEYTKRTDYTIAPFPELNSEALGFVYRMLTTGIGHNEFTEEPDKKEELAKFVDKKDFIKLYTFAQIETAGALNRESLQGEWVKYSEGSDHHALENTLRGKGTGWCTAEGSAYSHLQGGDFYVYYTKGKSGTYSEPRVAIRMEGNTVGEVRGVNHRQELEPALVDIASQKCHELPGGEKFDKKSDDMKKVTEIWNKCFTEDKTTKEKTYLNPKLSKDDLMFLYEVNSSIEGFGYDRDPRIKELRDLRNTKEDMPIVFECTPDQIAHSVKGVDKNTKAYVGNLEPGIFDKISHLENIYTSFPEGKINQLGLEVGGKTKKELQKELEKGGFRISDYAKSMMENKDFTPSKYVEKADFIRLTVGALGFLNGATTDQIYQKAEELGLELCPADTGPHLRLAYKDQLNNEYLFIGMKPITDSDGYPGVFSVGRDGGGLWLDDGWAGPTCKWGSGRKFVFRLRKKKL